MEKNKAEASMRTMTKERKKEGPRLRRRTSKADAKASRQLLLLCIPAIIGYLLFNYVPMFAALIIPFKNYKFSKGILGSAWCGLANFKWIIQFFGGDPVDVYMNPKYWPFILTVVNLWKGIGMGSMMYFAALMGIDTSLYEAAEIDGAGRFQKMLHISLPHLVPLICIFTIMNASSLINGNFDLFYVIPRNTSTLYATTDILNTYVYRSLQESSYAIGATTGLIQSVVGMFLVLLSNWIVKKISPDNSMF